MNDDELLVLLGRCTFRHSKPDGYYKDEPHEYIVRTASEENQALFTAMKEKLKTDGFTQLYTPPDRDPPQTALELGKPAKKRRPYKQRYYDVGGYRYWAFWLILNREKLPDKETQDR